MLNSAEKFNQSPVGWRAAVGPVNLDTNLIALASKSWTTKWFEPDNIADVVCDVALIAPNVVEFLHKGRVHMSGRKRIADDLGVERCWYGVQEVEKLNG
jgi:hypothetical protein